MELLPQPTCSVCVSLSRYRRVLLQAGGCWGHQTLSIENLPLYQALREVLMDLHFVQADKGFCAAGAWSWGHKTLAITSVTPLTTPQREPDGFVLCLRQTEEIMQQAEWCRRYAQINSVALRKVQPPAGRHSPFWLPWNMQTLPSWRLTPAALVRALPCGALFSVWMEEKEKGTIRTPLSSKEDAGVGAVICSKHWISNPEPWTLSPEPWA